MKEHIEKLIRDYPQLKMELNCLQVEMSEFEGISANEAIESMHFVQPEGERVQKSDISDSTGRIALSYKTYADRINREWYNHLQRKHTTLAEDLRFFEAAIRALNPLYAELMVDMVLNRMHWDDLALKYHVCRMSISRYRKRAIIELVQLYSEHEKVMTEYLLD